MSESKDDIIHNLALALRMALYQAHIERAAGPVYRVPHAIQGDLWLYTRTADLEIAIVTINRAVDTLAGYAMSETTP